MKGNLHKNIIKLITEGNLQVYTKGRLKCNYVQVNLLNADETNIVLHYTLAAFTHA